jgi:uncharacterized membrane protein
MSLSNLYVALETGWGLGVAITACVLSFSMRTLLQRIGLLRTNGYGCTVNQVQRIRAPFSRQWEVRENTTFFGLKYCFHPIHFPDCHGKEWRKGDQGGRGGRKQNSHPAFDYAETVTGDENVAASEEETVHYFPLAVPFLLILVFFFILVIALIEVGLLQYAYERIGIGRRHMFALLILTLLGSYINIPVAELPAKDVVSGQQVPFFGMQYRVPHVTEWPRTIIAVNLGGAVIPTILSLYLLIKNRLYLRGLMAVSIVTLVTQLMAHPVRGVGIAVPIFIPPLVGTAAALLLSRKQAPPLAYIASSLGTLIGADLMNLGKIQGLGAPVASIGGAGTFDGIFVAGIVSVLLASLMTRKGRGRDGDLEEA